MAVGILPNGMENKMDSNVTYNRSKQNFYHEIKQILHKKHRESVWYMVELMGLHGQEEATRKQACARLMQQLQQPYPASRPTIRKWFGLNGYAVPTREQVYCLGFALHMKGEQLDHFLREGIGQVGVQYNDYREVIFLFSLENGYAYDQALEMIAEYEQMFEVQTEMIHTHSTNQLMKEFAYHKHHGRRAFMKWMMDNSQFFKGYSLTTLDYLHTYKYMIMDVIREDSKRNLDNLMRETDFALWLQLKCNTDAQKEYQMIEKYIASVKRKKRSKVSEDLLDQIHELNRIGNSDRAFNSTIVQLLQNSAGKPYLPEMTSKHLSDLLSLPVQKEREIRSNIAENVLKNMDPEERCPGWIVNFIADYTKDRYLADTVGEASMWVDKFCKEHHRRCRLIQREDFLPMILYVSQRQYQHSIEQKETRYRRDDAFDMFRDMVNATFAACGMRKWNPMFQLDSLLAACFQRDDMFYYSELCDAVKIAKEEMTIE